MKVYVCKGCEKKCLLEVSNGNPPGECPYGGRADWRTRKGQRKLVFGNLDWNKRLEKRKKVKDIDIDANDAELLRKEFGGLNEGIQAAVKFLIGKLS